MEGKETDDDYDDRVNFGLKKTGGDSVAAPRKDPLTAQELVDKVQEFFYGSDELASYFENFVKENAHIVDLSSDEFKLEYTAVYNDFRQLFEYKLEDYIERELGATVKAFYLALKERMEEDSAGNEAVFGQILISVSDFDIFMQMMREEAQNIARK